MTDRTVRVVLQAVVGQYRQAMRDAARDTRDLERRTDDAAGNVGQNAAEVGSKLADMGQKVSLAGGAMLAGFGVAANAAADFEAEMSGVKAVSNASAAEMKQLADAALQAGADTVFSATEAAQAEAELAKAGIKTADILGGALRGSLDLAAAGQLELADAASISAQAMNIFNLQGKDVGHIADVLAAAANKSAADVKDLGDGLRQAGLVAAQTGLSLEETAGALAAFADSALVGSDAGTSLKTMLQRLANPAGEAAAVMEELGITAYDAQGQFVGLERFAGSLRQGLSKLTDQQKSAALSTIFGSDAVRAAAILYDQGAAGIQDYVESVHDQGAAARMAATQMDNLKGDVEALKGSLETAFVKGGSGSIGVLRSVTQTTTDLVNAYASLPAPVQQGATALLGVAGATAVMGGAAMIGVGQLAKFKASLIAVGVSAQRTSALVGRAAIVMKSLGVVGVSLAAVFGLDALAGALGRDVKLEQLGEDLVDYAQQAVVAGELARIAGKDFEDLGEVFRTASTNKYTGVFKFWDPKSMADIKQARNELDALDKQLTAIASINPEAAAVAFRAISSAAQEQGISLGDVNAAFDDYHGALAKDRTQQKLAGAATENLTGQIDEQTKAAQESANAIKALADQVRASFDPIFAAQDALAKQAQTQKDLNKAIKEHGKNSTEAKEAELEFLRATVDVDSAVSNLTAGLRDESVSLQTVNARLDAYVRAGLISAAQAKRFKDQLAGVAREAGVLGGTLDTLNGKHPKPKVTAPGLAEVKTTADRLYRRLELIDGKTVSARVVLSWIDDLPGGKSLRELIEGGATGGYITAPGTATSDSGLMRVSNGEYLINAAATRKHRRLLDMINGGGQFVPMGAVMNSYGGSTTASRVEHNDNRSFAPTVNVTSLPGERLTSNLPRALQEAAFMAGFDT